MLLCSLLHTATYMCFKIIIAFFCDGRIIVIKKIFFVGAIRSTFWGNSKPSCVAQGHSDGKCKFVWYWSLKKDKQDCFFNFCAKKGISSKHHEKCWRENNVLLMAFKKRWRKVCEMQHQGKWFRGIFFGLVCGRMNLFREWRGYKRRQEVKIWDEGWQRMQISAVCQREGCQM